MSNHPTTQLFHKRVPQSEITRPPMSEKEVKYYLGVLTESDQSRRTAIFELHDRKGWATYGYKSWEQFCEEETEYSARHVRRILAAATVEKNLALGHPIAESHLRELAVIKTPEGQIRAYNRARELARQKHYKGKASKWNGKISAMVIRQAVREELGLPANAPIKEPTRPIKHVYRRKSDGALIVFIEVGNVALKDFISAMDEAEAEEYDDTEER